MLWFVLAGAEHQNIQMCLVCSERGIVVVAQRFLFWTFRQKKPFMDQGIWAILKVINGKVVAKNKLKSPTDTGALLFW